MCGILGYISEKGYSENVSEKLHLIKHRGPDGTGVHKQTGANL